MIMALRTVEVSNGFGNFYFTGDSLCRAGNN